MIFYFEFDINRATIIHSLWYIKYKVKVLSTPDINTLVITLKECTFSGHRQFFVDKFWMANFVQLKTALNDTSHCSIHNDKKYMCMISRLFSDDDQQIGQKFNNSDRKNSWDCTLKFIFWKNILTLFDYLLTTTLCISISIFHNG